MSGSSLIGGVSPLALLGLPRGLPLVALPSLACSCAGVRGAGLPQSLGGDGGGLESGDKPLGGEFPGVVGGELPGVVGGDGP